MKALAFGLTLATLAAQDTQMPGMQMPGMNMPGMNMPGMNMPGQTMDDMNPAAMSLMNLASGTSVNPAGWSMPMLMAHLGSWNTMFMGTAFIVDTQQSGPRGGDKLYSPNVFMAAAEHRGRYGLFLITRQCAFGVPGPALKRVRCRARGRRECHPRARADDPSFAGAHDVAHRPLSYL